MKIAYYLTPGRKKNLYCRISDGTERVTFSLEYAVDPKKWKAQKDSLDDNDIHFFTLQHLKEQLTAKYHSLKAEGKENVLAMLKVEAERLMDGKGLDEIAKTLFDLDNEGKDVPRYDEFIQAFEKYSGLTKGQYKVQPLDELMHIYTNNGLFVLDTYQGLEARLEGFVERRSCIEIYTQTESWIWREIYSDSDIKKHQFMSQMLSNWENFWDEEYKEISDRIGRSGHLDKLKEKSWRRMQVLMSCFDNTGDIIELAEEIDETDLYPLVIITLIEINVIATCYEEYCNIEFEQENKWECITLNEEKEDEEGPYFYIKPFEV